MELTQKQIYRLATMIKPSVVIEYINNNRSDYEKWLKEEELKEAEVCKNVKVHRVERKQEANK